MHLESSALTTFSRQYPVLVGQLHTVGIAFYRRAGANVSCPAFFDSIDTAVMQVYRSLAGRTQMVLCVQGGCGGNGEDCSPTPSPS